LVSYFPSDLAAAVRELARSRSATLFSTLLSAFQITLSKWTGERDIVVGTPVANRGKPVVRETMGYFSGVVPLRGQVDTEQSFSAHLKTVHDDTVESFANAMPFAELAQALGDVATPGHAPVFEVRFALQNHPIPDVALPGLSAKLTMRSTGTARFHLACEVTEEGEKLEVVWLFRSSIFPQMEIEDLGRKFQAVLASACRSPESRINALAT
jgi:non-ribosomal peptide synthetase component F